MPGFKTFHLLKGATTDTHTLYASHSVWESRAAFVAWTQSEAFRKAHAQANPRKGTYLGHPELETFESVSVATMSRRCSSASRRAPPGESVGLR